MALASTTLLRCLSSFPSSPLCSPPKFFFFSTPFLPSSSIHIHSQLILSRPSYPFRPFSTTSSSSALTATCHPHLRHQVEHDESLFSIISDSKEDEKLWVGEEEEGPEPLTEHRQETEPVNASLPSFPTPKLTIKEKKELASYANSLGKKLKSQQVGKSGVTPTVAAAMVEALEANELLKLKVHGSCPGELSDVIKQLESATGSAAVGQIGRTVILYRPSLAKMKKKDADRSRKQQQMKPVKSVTDLRYQKKAQATKTFSRSQL